jgi:hypothetical protein
MKLKKMDISGAMSAEAALARREAKQLDDAVALLPDDSPLKAEANGLKSKLGDLSGLPANHPLRVELEQAKIRYEENKQEQEEQPDKDAFKLRRAKRLATNNEKTKQRIADEQKVAKVRNSAKLLENSVREVREALKRLQSNLEASMPEFDNGDRYLLSKVQRIGRTIIAVDKGLVDATYTLRRIG